MRLLPEDGHWVEDGQEWLFECLSCGKKKAHFNPSKGVGTCFFCERVYRWRDFSSEGWQVPSFSGRSMSLMSKPGDRVPAMSSRAASDYLQARGVDAGDWPTVVWDGTALGFPVFHAGDGHACYMRRTLPSPRGKGLWLAGEGMRKGECLFGWSMDPTWYRGKDMIVVEGVFDVLTPRLKYGLALLGSRLHPLQESFLVRAAPALVHVWMDPDPAGRKAEAQILASMAGQGIHCRAVEFDKEPGDCRLDEIPSEWRF